MEKTASMTPYLKSKINLLYLVCMIALLFVHNYNFAFGIMTPSTIVSGRFSPTNFIELLFSNSLFRFRMALLMAISGYLMANSAVIPYHQLVIKKIKSLAIPFIIISVIGLVITMLFETALFGLHNTNSHGMIGKSIWNFSFADWFRCLFLTPVSFQLWYIKVIFMLALLSPIIRFILTKFPVQTLAIAFIIWMFTNYLDGEIRDRAFIFYLVGFSLRLHNIDISKPFAFLKPTVALGIFIAIALLRTTLAFSGLEHIMNLKTILTILFKINEIAGVYAVWFCIDKVTSQIVATNWYARFGKCSFFIYAFHAPLINYISEYCLIKNIYAHPAAHLLLYVVLPVLVVFIIVNAEHLVKIYCPKFFLLVTGGRGADMLQTIALVQSSTEQRVQFGKLRRLYTALINEHKQMPKLPFQLNKNDAQLYMFFPIAKTVQA